MATLKNVHFGIHINEARWSSSSSGWSLILNTGGIDVLNSTVDYKRKFPEGHARQFPQEGFARVFSFGTKFQPNFFDWVPTDFNVQTDLLNPSSARFDIHGDDLIRPLHVVLWGRKAVL